MSAAVHGVGVAKLTLSDVQREAKELSKDLVDFKRSVEKGVNLNMHGVIAQLQARVDRITVRLGLMAEDLELLGVPR